MKIISALILFYIIQTCFAQKLLDLHYYSVFGKQKTFQFFNNSKFSYKLKGKILYQTHKLVNMQDSILVFDNDCAIKLSQIKAIKINRMMISPYFFGAGVLFFLLDTGHNIAFGNPVINEQAVLVSSAFFAGGLIAAYFQNKHVHVYKNTTLRIIDADYQNLNTK